MRCLATKEVKIPQIFNHMRIVLPWKQDRAFQTMDLICLMACLCMHYCESAIRLIFCEIKLQFQGGTSFVELLCFCSVLCLLCLCTRLFICALWSPAGKGLTSWLSFVVSNCEIVTFPLVSWVGCGTLLYRLLIFAPLLTNI